MTRSARLGVVALAFLALGCGNAELEADAAAWAEAEALARSGLAELDAGRPTEGQARLRSAVAVLFRAGLLDDVERALALETGLERIEARIEEGSELRKRFQALSVAEASLGRPACQIDWRETEGSQVDPCLAAGLAWLLVELRQSAPAPAALTRQVAETLERERAFLERALPRGGLLVPMMKRELERKRLPPLLHYLALIESGYVDDARSVVGAAGLWQFTRGTAGDYGLVVTAERDDRLDPERSTQAAASYLQDLALEFGGDSLFLVLAGYNAGPNRVRRALRELDDPFEHRSYWHLVERGLLAEETTRYVARFLAAALAGEFGLREALMEAG
ncbi:MAG: lytic transglycosylase domain-containing protein [bacterium]|nr:lytic transglycosylase domain-containing protein [bacterium]